MHALLWLPWQMLSFAMQEPSIHPMSFLSHPMSGCRFDLAPGRSQSQFLSYGAPDKSSQGLISSIWAILDRFVARICHYSLNSESPVGVNEKKRGKN